MRTLKVTVKKSLSWIMIVAMLVTLVPINSITSRAEIVPDNFVEQPGGENTWRLTGDFEKAGIGFSNWNPGDENAKMKHLVGKYYAISIVLPADTYEFQFTKNGDWAGQIGKDGGGNFSITLSETTKVNFYLNEESPWPNMIASNLGGYENQGIKHYDPSSPDYLGPEVGNEPRLVGSIQKALGEANEWSPENSQLFFVDYFFDGTVFKLQRTVPVGLYECKVTFGNAWGGIESSNGNVPINVLDESDVTFTINYSDKVLSHNYVPKDSLYDGLINTSALYFDSRSVTYKKPFGAVRQSSEDVTFRIAAEAGDAQLVRLELINEQGVSNAYEMAITTVLNGKDYWEVTVPKEDFDEIGIWGYKFVVVDGTTKVEYGAANSSGSGGIGASSEEGQMPYNLTVYAEDFKTPDWMKEAVVYQIFVDRFFDGDTTNNRAKVVDGYRGYIDEVTKEIKAYLIQYFDKDKVANDPVPDQVWGSWSDYPENPRHGEKENKPYYPDSETDGIWTNEFYGGDIEGVQKKIAYLKTLGITAIYLNPVSWAASNHKYDATDYHHLDPMFGEPVYNTPGDPKSGLNYTETRKKSDEVYFAFAQACYDNDIRIIVDGVFNHVGDDSIYFDRYEKYPEIGAYEFWKRVWDEVAKTIPSLSEEASGFAAAKASAVTKVKNYYKSLTNPMTGKNYTDSEFNYTEWFTVGPGKTEEGIYKYEAWWGFDSLPAIDAKEADQTNLTNDSNATIAGTHEYNVVDYRNRVIGYDLNQMTEDEAKKAIQEANSQRWLWMGSSGWRLDVAPDVSDETWVEFRKAVKSAKDMKDVNNNTIDDPIILGEEWSVATHYLLGDMFDSVMNYQFRNALQDYMLKGDAAVFHEKLETIRENYPKEAWEVMLNLVDSHDTVRNITKMDTGWEEENIKIAPEASDKAMKLQALTAIFQMSYPGAPTVYYGDEVAVTGTKDPDSRRSFPWDRIKETTSGGKTTYEATAKYSALFNAYAKAANIRNNNGNLFTTGEMKLAYAEDKVIAYARKSNTKGGLVVINQSEKAVTISADVTDFLPEGIILKDELGGTVTATVIDEKIEITVPALTGMMMVSTTTFEAIPEAPVNLAAEAIDGPEGEVKLTWDPVDGATSYEVYRTLLEGMEVVKLGTVNTNNYTDSDVTNGTRYYYYVKTVKGNAKSLYSNVATALPSYLIDYISVPSQVPEMTIGVDKKTEDILVDINIPGLTDNEKYADTDVPGLNFTLVYHLQNDTENARETKLRYKGDVAVTTGAGVTAKVYTAAFEPTESGAFEYYAKATVNNGLTYEYSGVQIMTANPGQVETVNKPVLEEILTESNRATLKWSVEDESESIKGFDIYRKVDDGKFIKIAVVDSKIREYIDFSVKNDTTYTYKVAAYDIYYNRGTSNEEKVTPKLVMIDVTLRLNIPSYTPLSDDIYIAGDVNGWNASGWKMSVPSGATTRDVVEYSFKMMAGKKIQYKYTRGNWETEAFTNKDPDEDVPTQYAYSSMDTNIHLTVTNQGGNKMLVEETVLRWVDMPLMVILPRTSFKGEDIEYSTDEETYDLKASVPWGVEFTINDKDINELYSGAMDGKGNVEVDNIPLKSGLNTIVLHIEPTEETLSKPWFEDKGRASQATGTVTMKITRTSGGTTNPNPPTTPGGELPPTVNPSTPGNVQDIPGVSVEKNNDGTSVISVDKSGEYDFAELKVEGTLEIKGDNVVIKNINTTEPIVIKGNNVTVKDSEIKNTTTISGNNVTIENTVASSALTLSGNNTLIAGSTINAPLTIKGNNTMVEDTVISGEVLIEGNNATITSSKINGKLDIKGGTKNTVNILSTQVNDLVIKKPASDTKDFITLRISGATVIDKLDIKAPASIRMDTVQATAEIVNIKAAQPVIKNMYISVPSKTIVSLRGQFEDVTLSSPKARVKLKSGTIGKLTVQNKAVNSIVILSKNTKIENYNLTKATTLNGEGTSKLKVKVYATKIVLNNKAKSIKVGKKFTLKTSLTPKASLDTITFKSGNKKVAKVNKKGVITGISKGKAVITAITKNGKTAKCTVTVK